MELGCNWRIGSDRVETLWAQWVGGHSKVWTWGDSVTEQGVTVNRPSQSDRWNLNGTVPLVLWESWFWFDGVAVVPTGHLFNLRVIHFSHPLPITTLLPTQLANNCTGSVYTISTTQPWRHKKGPCRHLYSLQYIDLEQKLTIGPNNEWQ